VAAGFSRLFRWRLYRMCSVDEPLYTVSRVRRGVDGSAPWPLAPHILPTCKSAVSCLWLHSASFKSHNNARTNETKETNYSVCRRRAHQSGNQCNKERSDTKTIKYRIINETRVFTHEITFPNYLKSFKNWKTFLVAKTRTYMVVPERIGFNFWKYLHQGIKILELHIKSFKTFRK